MRVTSSTDSALVLLLPVLVPAKIDDTRVVACQYGDVMQKVIKHDERWGIDRQVNTGSIEEFKYYGMGQQEII